LDLPGLPLQHRRALVILVPATRHRGVVAAGRARACGRLGAPVVDGRRAGVIGRGRDRCARGLLLGAGGGAILPGPELVRPGQPSPGRASPGRQCARGGGICPRNAISPPTSSTAAWTIPEPAVRRRFGGSAAIWASAASARSPRRRLSSASQSSGPAPPAA